MTSTYTYNDLAIREDALLAIRMAIYHSTGPGYHLFKGFLTPEQAAHVREVWLRPETKASFEPFEGKDKIVAGCPNFYSAYGDGNQTFHNFLWNLPADELSYSSTLMVQLLRNRVEGQMAFYEVFPYNNQSVSYRVVLTRNCGVWAEWHRDWYAPEEKMNKDKFSLNRLQATLFLSEYGLDYGGEGFCFEDNQGKKLIVGRDLAIQPGDLMLWRYNNRHGVANVTTEPHQLGFMRIIYPPERRHPVPFERNIADGMAVRPRPGGTVRGLLGAMLRRLMSVIG